MITDWKMRHLLSQAACAGEDINIWFPSGGYHYDRARLICGSCPVRDQCLELAMEGESGPALTRSGMFGGLTPVERAALARAR